MNEKKQQLKETMINMLRFFFFFVQNRYDDRNILRSFCLAPVWFLFILKQITTYTFRLEPNHYVPSNPHVQCSPRRHGSLNYRINVKNYLVGTPFIIERAKNVKRIKYQVQEKQETVPNIFTHWYKLNCIPQYELF